MNSSHTSAETRTILQWGWFSEGVAEWPGVAQAINGGRGLSRCGIKRFTTGPQISTDAMDECAGGSPPRHPSCHPTLNAIWVRLPESAILPRALRPPPIVVATTLSCIHATLSQWWNASDTNRPIRSHGQNPRKFGARWYRRNRREIKCYCTRADIFGHPAVVVA